MKAINCKLTALKLLTGDSTIMTMPHSVGFQSTCFCNLRCPHCQTHGTEEVRKAHNSIAMPEEMMRRVAAEVLPAATDYLFSVSGEPLAAGNFAGLVEEFLPYQAKLQIHTNATLFNKEKLSALIPAAMRIYLSMDAATEFTFEETRKGARYNRVLHNIGVLTRAVELLPVTLRPEIYFWCTILGSNIRELPTLVTLAHLFGVTKVHGHFVTVFFDHIRNEAVEYHRGLYNAYYAQAHAVAASYEIELWLPPPFEGIEPNPEAPLGGENMIIEQFPEDYYTTRELPQSRAELVDIARVEREAKEIKEDIVRRCGGSNAMSSLRGLLRRVPWSASGAKSEDDSVRFTVKQMKAHLDAVCRKHDSHLKKIRENSGGSIQYCESLYKRIYLSPSGDVRPCCYVDHVLGNVNEDTVREIWNSEAYTNCRNNFLTGTLFKECLGCKESLALPREELLAEVDQSIP